MNNMVITGVSLCAKCIAQSPPRKMYKFVVLILLQFLITFAQGQGPGTEFTVYEGVKPGTVIGTLPITPSYTYTFNEPQSLFSLHPTTGELSTKATLDRESLSTDRLNILVISSPPSGSPKIPIEIYITVLDINDNSPTFPQRFVRRSLSEKANIGYKIRLDTATDHDLGKNGNVSEYRIIARNDENKFKTVFDPSNFGQFLYLELINSVNREEKSSYEITIQASDQGNPPKSGDLTVNISITDANDNPPIFTLSQYTAVINESSPINTLVIRVEASDLDIGSNGDIYYTLTDDTNQFRIDDRTGEIRTLTTPLQCSSICQRSLSLPCNPYSCLITLEAWDKGNPPLNGRAYVTISIKDENDHAPKMKINYQNNNKNYSTVNENAKKGERVAIVTISDEDTGLFGNISSFEIVSGNELNHFKVASYLQYKYNFILVNVESLDRERISIYNLTLQAADMGSPPKMSRVVLSVHVIDINDHAPVFPKDSYLIRVSETIPVGSFVANLRADDKDSGVNALLSYKILSGNDAGWFEINSNTGLVTTKKRLKFNIAPQMVMNISAQDGGTNPYTSYTRLTVLVSDENDMAPTFEKQIFNVNIQEGLDLGTQVIVAKAEDYDSGSNGTVVYHLHRDVQEQYPNTFGINTLTGRITTMKRLDREEISHYIIHVVAQDKGVPPLSSTATILLTVLDKNDNIPRFYPERYFANVKENEPSGTSVTQVIGNDPDLGDGGRIYYSFTNDYAQFVLDTNTGLITTTQQLSRSIQKVYTLEVTCRDENTVHRAFTNAVVTVTIVSSESSLPRFIKKRYNFNVMENVGDLQTVGTVAASGGGSSLTYVITSGDSDSSFTINEKSGQITTSDLLDREHISQYQLKVTALGDLGATEVNVIVDVLDKNDNKPKFVSSLVDVEVNENWPVGHEIFYAFAADTDAGNNGAVLYTLSSSVDLFQINPNSGMITLTKPFEEYYGSYFSVNVTATDSGTPQLSSTMMVRISVLDVNDHNPVFPKTDYAITLLESTQVNTQFYVLTATDADTGKNAELFYNITRGNGDVQFGIFPDGKLFIAQKLDRERRDLFKLTVTARDHGIPARSSAVNVTIHILDSNDNRPMFVNQTYNFYVSENLPPGQKIGAVKATDADIGRNAELAFFLAEGEDSFSIDFQTGEISTQKVFDREKLISESGNAYYMFEVTVSDNGVVKQTDKATVRVHITDQNDNAPTFSKPVFSASVKENTAKFSHFYTVTAHDLDEAENAALTYTIISGNKDKMFDIGPGNGQITLAENLDMETQDFYSLTIQVTDNGKKNQYTASAVVQIHVLDVNDNSPLFAQTVYDIKISEGKRVGERLAQISATDTDTGINSEIEYTLQSSDTTFVLDRHNGNLYLAKSIDYETKKLYNLVVLATDKGEPRLSTEAIINVRITDINDNSPKFKISSNIITISEDVAQFSKIGQISATDKDSGPNGEIRYYIANQDPPGSDFKLHPIDGSLRVESPMDREKVSSYILSIIATDQASPNSSRLSSEKLFTVIVTDINDNAPELQSSPAIALEYPTSQGVIGTIYATDADTSVNGKITYQLIQGANFQLDSTTGKLYLSQNLQQSPTIYNLNVRIADSGLPTPKSIDVVISVILYPKNLIGPSFTGDPYIFSVKENVPSGSQVQQVLSSSEHVQYYITDIRTASGQQGYFFNMDKATGMITTHGEMDREVTGPQVNLTVCARDTQSSMPKASLITVTINIQDVNDSPPRFSNTSFVKSVGEDLPFGSEILRITVTDLDTSSNLLSLKIVDGNNDGRYALDSQTGSLTIAKKLNREVRSVDRLRIESSDGKNKAEAAVKILITDTNDNAPVFTKSIYSFDILENTPTGTTVAWIEALDADEGLNGDVLYSILSDWGQNIFELDSKSGTFKLIKAVDYEQNHLFTLTVLAQDQGSPAQSTSVLVYMNIKDVNDNSPQFDPASYSGEVWENVAKGTSVLTVSATDSDSGINSQILYTVVDSIPSSDFNIGNENGTLYTVKELDRETISNYSVVVMAVDQAQPPSNRKSMSTVVTISVKDVNDNSPEFVTPSHIWIKENTPTDTVAYVVKAIDRDDGTNGEVMYSLVSHPAFSLSPTTGEIIIKTRLDRELVQNYTLQITATDQGKSPKSTSQNLKIYVQDENDNPPVFYPTVYTQTVSEDVKIGTTLLRVTATDRDAGLNGVVRFFITHGDGNADFSMDPSSGLLRVQKNLDYERVSKYHLTIQAEDMGVKPRYSVANITITVEDINDFQPVFLNSPFYALVRENMASSPPVPVLQLSAQDRDSAPNSQLTYSLREGDKSVFQVNSTSGEVTCHKSLDREAVSQYKLVVVAIDSGSNRLTGSGTVFINVEDVNDNSPEFEQKTVYVGRILENQSGTQDVLSVKATDLDEGSNAHISYKLLDDMDGKFTINPNTGMIQTQQPLDREETPYCILIVIAEDHGSMSKSATANVTIFVDDVNDNQPKFEKPSYHQTLNNPTSLGQFVAGVTALDRDAGMNGRVTYSLLGPDASNFNLDASRGTITTAKTLSGAGRVFTCQIQAKDQGIPAKTSVVSLTVNISSLDVSNIPHFNQVTQPSDLNEGTNIGYTLTTVQAQSSVSASVRYYIAGGNVGGTFSIGESSGVVSVAREVDYEMTPGFRLWIQAQDTSNALLSAYHEISVTVIDQNDNAPVFDKTMYVKTIMENAPVNSPIVSVKATDADGGNNGNFVYVIVGGNVPNIQTTFSIDASSGQIKTITSLDRETQESYNVIVEARDQGTPSKTGTTTVRVTVIDVNDNPPIFSAIFSKTIPEDTPVGSFIIQVTSTDADTGNNAKSNYSIESHSGLESKFRIDAQSGNITLVSALDAEAMKIKYIPIDVVANDGHHETRGSVYIFVDDVNDNSPQIQPPITFNFLEHQPVGSFVGTLLAIDNDKSSPNNQVYFSLKLPSSDFMINDKNGTITSKSEMAYTYHKSFSNSLNEKELVVIATDLGTPARSSETVITIEIIDANDHAPKFEQNSYFSAVPENAIGGESILFVKATDDLDFGLNAKVEYSIDGGNGSSHFFINKTTGLITVAQSLSGQQNRDLMIEVRAQDKGLPPMSSVASVRFTITTVNNNAPVFQTTKFTYDVRENAEIGQTVATIVATDSDLSGPNGKVTYHILDGNTDGLFAMNSENGMVSVAQALDYDTVPIHQLNISAQDSALLYKEVTDILTVRLIDINDNPPVFDQSQFDGYVAENSPSDTSIVVVGASDADSGENARIEYYISESGSDPLVLNLFKIDQYTGTLRTKGNLDYETKTQYSMIVMARNPNSDMKSSTMVTVHVTGVNEFYPVFQHKTYKFSTKESAKNGSIIGNVKATDRDHGEDGKVFYYLIASSNLRGFSVNFETGDIFVSGKPDYESSPHVVLNVLAKNRGSIMGNDSDTCVVRISVEDANDPPVFSQTVYSASVLENSGGGISVTKVSATDKDIMADDSVFSFSILSGNTQNAFSINPNSGIIYTTGKGVLDRETMPIYNVTVGAIDRGSPPATGSALVRITLQDENDNPPFFNPRDLTGYVMENVASGTLVMDLSKNTSDLDLPPNQDPYRYQVVAGGHNSFFVISSEGLVRTNQKLDREATPQFDVPVIVNDAGKPSRTSTLTFHVVVQDENDSPPMPRNMNIQISLHDNNLPSGPVADVRPLDSDTIGSYTCSVANIDQYFSINTGCQLFMTQIPPTSLHRLKIDGSDGRGSVSYDVDVTLLHFQNSTLDNIVVIQVSSITKIDFVKDKFNGFKNSVLKLFGSGHKVEIFDVETLTGGIDCLVYLSVFKANGDIILHDLLKQQLISNKNRIQSEVGIFITKVGYSICKLSTCHNNVECLNKILVNSRMNSVDSPSFVLTSQALQPDFYCNCPPQYTGKLCDVPVSPCGQGFCSNGGKCQNGVCKCTDGWTGKNCTDDINECAPEPCQNGATCDNSLGSFTCHCLDGYTGHYCETGSNHCQSDPCENGGSCKNEVDGYVCHCPFSYWGNKCQFTSKGFSELSFMEFSSIDQNQYNIDLDVTFSTVKKNALLLYNPAWSSNEFVALEIVAGRVRFSFNLGDPEATILTVPKDVSTGDWFRVQIQRIRETADLRVSHCPITSTECEVCRTGDSSCYQQGRQKTNSVLTLDGHPLYIGGVKDIQTILDHSNQVSSHDFVGCMREFKINSVDFLKQRVINQKNIVNTCPRSESSTSCLTKPCQNGGLCVDEWEGFSCHCQNGYSGKLCQQAPGPIGFGSNSRVTFVQKESFRRDELVGQSSSRKRRAEASSSVLVRFRTTAAQGPLLIISSTTTTGVLWVDSGKVVYTYGTESVEVTDSDINSGKWLNATVSITGSQVTVGVDNSVQTGSISQVLVFSDVNITKMTLGSAESPVTAGSANLKGFDGCISTFEIDGSPLPLNGSTDRFIITPSDSVESGCSAICAGNPCGAGSSCSVNQEIRVCAQVADKNDATLSVGIIVVIAFFGVVLIVIGVIFVVFRMRKQKRSNSTNNLLKLNKNGHVNKSYNNSPNSHQDSGYGEQDFNIIDGSGKTPNGFHKPDLINSDISQRKPYEIDDGTVIIDNGDVNMNQLNDDMPEHYDLENASSIAPSDIDVHMHYKGYRDGRGYNYHERPRRSSRSNKDNSAGGWKKPVTRESPGPGALKLQTSGRLRSSPATNLDVPHIHTHSARSSPANVGIRNSPINQLSRQSPQIRASPLTHSNVRGTPVSHVQHSRTDSEHSLASHHSSTSSSVPRTILPNGHAKPGRHRQQKYYDPNSRQIKGLTVEEIEKLNARPHRLSPVSMQEAVSSSEDGHRVSRMKMSTINSDVVLEPPESSSEDSANDSFTCSEFEYENDKGKNDFDPSAMIYSRVNEEEPEDSVCQNRTSNSDGLDSNGGSFASTVGSSEDGNMRENKFINGQFSWDYLMNWGPSYERLVGVFKDIASLPDGDAPEVSDNKINDCEEYV